MANLPSKHPHLSLHLTDRALTPLITSAAAQSPPSSSSPPRPSRLEALTALSHAALSAHESASRLGLGVPLRVMLEHSDSGPIVLQSFLRADTNTNTNTTSSSSTTNNTNNPLSSSTTSACSSSAAAAAEHPDPEQQHHHHHPNGDVEHRLQQLQLTPSPDPGLVSEDSNTNPNNANNANAPPMLISIVVAPTADDARDARRAAARLERLGRAIQAQWAEVQDEAAGD